MSIVILQNLRCLKRIFAPKVIKIRNDVDFLCPAGPPPTPIRDFFPFFGGGSEAKKKSIIRVFRAPMERGGDGELPHYISTHIKTCLFMAR